MKVLYHCTTPKKLTRYNDHRSIIKPVRGFTTYEAAEYWARRHNRSIVLRIEGDERMLHKLPDHHNKYGEAWWFDCDVQKYEIVEEKLIPNTWR
jgi:hypothetical protein